MPDSSLPPQDRSQNPFEGEWSMERAIRESLSNAESESVSDAGAFSPEDHLGIARSGAADLSREERSEFLGTLHTKGSAPVPEYKRESKPIPLFFGSWSGMNPFRLLKPFYLTRKRS